ncbi:hypothetical protein AMS68_006431 [Peltaster fructicola]|uniref:Vacuolar fusion protein MON1 n=1 Tax=Peltaster fructicola TaxID=286661 RepID=A0A6H0Y1M7_9PEZI|nr:hypothetical protein AMS68_006431 [Peltaster fructicola]
MPPAKGQLIPIDDTNEGTTASKGSAADTQHNRDVSRAITPPPELPPRPNASTANWNSPVSGTLRLTSQSSRPQLSSRPTTALSSLGVQTKSEARDTISSPPSRVISRKQSHSYFGRFSNSADLEDSASLRSYVPTLEAGADNISLFGGESSIAWQALKSQAEGEIPFADIDCSEDCVTSDIVHEFESLEAPHDGSRTDADILERWKLKLKHFFVLSASGKPIYSRHGDDKTISNYIGVVQTIVASFQSTGDQIKGFAAGNTRFVVLIRGPLTLVAISRLQESERQLQHQLESLYMQILSTLTLPSLERMFSARPSTDLRRPLQGTDVLLDGLCDGFTRGSPSTLLSALECLRMRKTHRKVINDTFLKVRSPSLIYGLLVAAGRLVSVVRPKKHSLHPGDLHLIFNMLFEAEGVKAGGGESWIPLCLPGFNNAGYLYMYVSFLSANTSGDSQSPAQADDDNDVATVLISTDKESFYELRKMRNELTTQLRSNGSMTVIQTSIIRGKATCADLVPGTSLKHFLYKSRSNVQFVMPSLLPDFGTLLARRKLMSLYHVLHDEVHARNSHLKVQHCASRDASALAWETPLFELYCVAGPHVSRTALCQGANRVVQWIRREEERVFIIGGAVF